MVITTGGLGPTVDDPTREAVALALGVRLVFQEDLWQQIQERFARFGRTPTENNRRQAAIPEGARALVNPIGTAPGFLIERDGALLIALPGVPLEMVRMLDDAVLPLLQKQLGGLVPLHARLLHAAGVGESWVDEQIQDLEVQADPTVGVLAHPGRVDIRIATKASSIEQARERWALLEAEIRRRLGQAVYGADEDTLPGVALSALGARGWRLATAEAGTQGALAALLSEQTAAWQGSVVLPAETPPAALVEWLSRLGGTVGLSLDLHLLADPILAEIALIDPAGRRNWSHSYGGPPESAPAWAATIALDRLRRHLT